MECWHSFGDAFLQHPFQACVIEGKKKNEQFNPRRFVSMTTIGGMNSSDYVSASHFQVFCKRDPLKGFPRLLGMPTLSRGGKIEPDVSICLRRLRISYHHIIIPFASAIVNGMHEAKEICLFIKI